VLPPPHFVLLTLLESSSGIGDVHLEHLSDPFFSMGIWDEDLHAGLASVDGIVRGSGGYIDADRSPEEACADPRIYPECARPRLRERGALRQAPGLRLHAAVRVARHGS
jgi:hypothetical protein